MGKLISIALIVAVLPINFLLSCPLDCLKNSADCPLFMLRAAISPTHFERNLQVIERTIQRAEEDFIQAVGLAMTDKNTQQEKLLAIQNRSAYQAKKDLVYVIAIIMGRLPKLMSPDDQKFARRIEIIAKFYPMAHYIETLLKARQVLGV